jgi:hypothetical protein
MYLLDQKMYTKKVIVSSVKSTLHYFFLRKSLICICLVASFLFKLNNKLSVLTVFAWSIYVMSWAYMNTLMVSNAVSALVKLGTGSGLASSLPPPCYFHFQTHHTFLTYSTPYVMSSWSTGNMHSEMSHANIQAGFPSWTRLQLSPFPSSSLFSR